MKSWWMKRLSHDMIHRGIFLSGNLAATTESRSSCIGAASGIGTGFSTYKYKQKKEKRWGDKPVSVPGSVIYLRNLPPGSERAALDCRYIWSCRPRDRTRPASLTAVVGSYPAFSPLPIRRHQNEVTDTWLAVVFCYGRNEITPICAFRSRVPCPVRTFLTVSGAADRPTFIFRLQR